jgi:opacity protein-like surface antigen
MRKIFLSLLVMTAAGTAQGADLDYDYLRGADYDPPPAVALIDWSGVYFGGHGGYTAGSFAQRKATQSALANYFNATAVESEYGVSNLVTFPGSRGRGASYGAFAGWNMQFGEAVLGLEADYTHTNQNAVSTYEINRIMTLSNGVSETVRLNGQSRTDINDYGTIRARAGYAIGNFLPYVTGGFAIGQVSFTDSAAVQYFGYDANTYAANQALPAATRLAVYNHGYASFNPDAPIPGSTPPASARDQTTITRVAPATNIVANNRVKTIGGIALGFGLEYALTPNILLRGEYQYVNFQSFNGHNAELNTIRGGAAVKF